jgi:hypothetical protein
MRLDPLICYNTFDTDRGGRLETLLRNGLAGTIRLGRLDHCLLPSGCQLGPSLCIW